jgi:ribosomal protein S18 acetylase RimI-like enzyme
VNEICLRYATVEDAPELARILVGTNRETFHGLVPDAWLDDPTLEESERNWRRAIGSELEEGEFLLVAENTEGTMLGFAMAGGKTGRDAERELNVLMVDTPWQRRGIGRMLVSEVAAKLKQRGIQSLLVGVQCDNPNRQFYERLGAKQIGSKPLNWAGYTTEEILLRWDAIDELLSTARA